MTSTNAANFTKFDNAGSDEYRAKIGSSMRRVTVSSYRGKKMVAIREVRVTESLVMSEAMAAEKLCVWF